MPQIRDERIFINEHMTFAQQIIKRTTSWSLEELKAAANVPSDAKINGDYHYDSYGDQVSLDTYSILFTTVEYFDVDGKPLKKVTKRTERQVVQPFYEEYYEPIGPADGAAPSEGTPNQTAA